MVQFYIKHTDDNYYLLDTDPDENVTFKVASKDLNDISKILSPYTQSVKFKATDKNKILFGFFGNEKTLRINNTGIFEVKAYVSGFLFQTGKLELKSTDYKSLEQEGFSGNFASNLTGLAETLGTGTIQELFDVNDAGLSITWDIDTLGGAMSSVTTKTLSNGIVLKTCVPLISNERVLKYETDLFKFDNIASNGVKYGSNAITLNEVRPAVNYMAVMNAIVKKLNVPIICPLFDELDDLFIWGSAEKLVGTSQALKVVNGNVPMVFQRVVVAWNVYENQNTTFLYPPALIAVDTNTNEFTVTGVGSNWNMQTEVHSIIFGFTLDNAVTSNPDGIKYRIVIRRTDNGAILNDSEVEGTFFQLNLPHTTFLYKFKIEIVPLVFMTWNGIGYFFTQRALSSSRYDVIYTYSGHSSLSSSTFGNNNVNAIATLPKKTVADFLRSFFKTFNITVVSTGLEDGSMYWLTQENIKEINKPYSKRTVNYTDYATPKTLTKKRANDYNAYSFSHVKSKYYEGTYGDGTAFGSLVYPVILPNKPVKYEIKTDYSILKQASTFGHPTIRTCLAFQKEGFEVLANGFKRYKPVFDEFTLFFITQKDLSGNGINVENNATTNTIINTALEASFKNPNGKTLAFGGEAFETNSLYKNYYNDFISLLLNPNAYVSTFELELPPNEIFLNFANLTQGESNIPVGFRAQNEIIIGEQRYYMTDISISLTGGKSKLNAINL